MRPARDPDDLTTQLRDAIDRAVAEALRRAPGATGVIRARAKALRRRVTGLAKAQRQLAAIGKKRAQRDEHGEDGSHGT